MAAKYALRDKLSSLWRIIKANIDRTAFIIFLGLLILMSGIYGYEITQPEPEFEVPPPGPIEKLLPNEAYEKAMSYIDTNTDLEKDEELKVIKYFNIFDYKYVRDKNELQKAADKKFKRAFNLYEDGKLDEAEKVLKSILLTWPSHLDSRELLDEIEAARATPTPTPTPERPPREGLPGQPPMIPGMGL